MSICSSARAVEVLDVQVRVKDGRYHLWGQSIIFAPRPFVFQVLADYDNFHKLAGGLVETRFLPDAPDGTRLGYTRLDTCVWFFCRKLEKVETVHLESPVRMTTEVIPERSDFRFNHTTWTLDVAENGTLVTYEAVIEPDFWMPPLIGPWAIKRKLRSSAISMGGVIEQMNTEAR